MTQANWATVHYIFFQNKTLKIEKIAQAPPTCFPAKVGGSLAPSSGTYEDSCDGCHGEGDISTKAKEVVRQCSCEQLAYNR